VNTYALFAELFDKAKKRGGRAGVIVPTGIATDALTAPFFADLVGRKRLSQVVDFDNRLPLFSSVHRMFKFSLLTTGDHEAKARFAFFLSEPSQLAEAERNFSLTPQEIAALNPNTRTAPVFRSRADAELTVKIYQRAPVLIEKGNLDSGNSWGLSHASTFFDMTRDSGFFHSASDLQSRGLLLKGNIWLSSSTGDDAFLPLFEAKFTSPDQVSEAMTAFVCPRVLELTYTSRSLAPFARDLGHEGPPFAWDEDRRAHLRADLDAFYARAYGLTRDELRYILDPEDVMGAGYPSETFRVLKNNDIRRFGEYRTARLVLAAWDAQEARPAAAQ
jgi:hypothetical protein